LLATAGSLEIEGLERQAATLRRVRGVMAPCLMGDGSNDRSENRQNVSVDLSGLARSPQKALPATITQHRLEP